MVLKYLTAAIVTVALAGGVVYLALDEDRMAALMNGGTVSAAQSDAPAPKPARTEPSQADIDDQLAILLAETAKLDIVDARNDAYLNILDLAVANEQYEVAQEIVDDITVPELRDTARQRIGISHAQAGRLEEAFAVLDDLDIEALSDPIRLEIIRSVSRQDR